MAEYTNKVKKRFTTSPLRVFMFVFLVLWSLSFSTLIVWLVANSLNDKVKYLTDPVGIPVLWKWSNYVNAFTELEAIDSNLVVMLINTLWLTAGNISLQVLSGVTFSYAIARFKFPGRDAIYWISIARMMIPIVGSLAATYKLYGILGIYDSPLLLLSNLSGQAGFLVYYATFKGVSNEYAEAAFLDGANHVQVFFKVMLPQVTGVVIALSVSSFIANWNEYMTPILFLPSYPTLASGIYIYQQRSGRRLNYPVLFAALVMTMIPCIITFTAFQKNFLSIDIGGGLKG